MWLPGINISGIHANEFCQPPTPLNLILAVAPIQLLNDHLTAHRYLAVDQLRNFAKSATVE
jgi:glucosamine 6-phosphate synthetase-like amidotransferase/phosphosugar isomerase protein